MDTKPLDLYEAAVFLELSPTLLEYFTKNSVKTGDTRKLQCSKVGELLLFDKNELENYNAWLKSPWPTPPKSNRPYIPKGIREDLKQEARLQCALCLQNGDSCEAAHIEPSHKSKCNHPHNLIWLCSNHHTKFDNGHLGPKGADNQDILRIKGYLITFRRLFWTTQSEATQQLASVLRICGELKTRLSQPFSPAHERFEQLAEEALQIVPALTKSSETQKVKPVLDKIIHELSAERLRKDSTTTSTLSKVASFENEFLQESGLVRCPLCAQRGSVNSYDCPVCNGEGTIDEDIDVDLREFDLVQCGLCEGKGRYHFDECGVCGGEGELERRYEERVDYSQYDLVDCPVCYGNGRFHGDFCRICDGDKKVLRRYAESIDMSDYEHDDCPLCEGSGRHNGGDCPYCHGERQVLRKYAQDFDPSLYAEVKCPACKGKGTLYGEDCIACGGERYMSSGQADDLDLSLYKLEVCPKCKGKSKNSYRECSYCNNEGELLKYYIVKYSY
ncbi:HNH endonuclease signature motif containing protein [Pseudomonas sp. ML96]|uniref:HNH endonuclease signature motif containing protein n=1 Tax=Pseudomonas sp. ML96 TaxID=1523503 RepID=UPI0009DF8E23|nr:HNH endonuclease signature motif containing protein [Pseudomonas sp. ML96]